MIAKENEKIITISNLFEGNTIRSIWNDEKEDYYFSVVDVIKALTSSNNPRKYWSVLKLRLKEEGSELTTNCSQLKMKSADGKFYKTDVLDTKGIFRLIESVPSPKAEPFKLWLATLGSERVDEIFDPELAINRAISYYENKGYDEEWIKTRLNAIVARKKLTDSWQKCGINDPLEYAMLTNEICHEWSGMTTKEYKNYKGLTKENLRDNMSDIELVLTDLSEITTRDIVNAEKPNGLEENLDVAKRGGKASLIAKNYYEEQTGKKVLSNNKRLK